MFDPLRIAIVGCGGMGWRHAMAILDMRRGGCSACEIVALCDSDEDRAAHLADRVEQISGYRPAVYTVLSRLLDDKNIEAVAIVLPTWLHVTAAAEALSAGKHVLIEKPLALSVVDCDRIIQAASKSGKVAAVAENYRRIPGNRAFRALLDAGTLGAPQGMMLQYCASAEEVHELDGKRMVAPAWYQDPRKGGSYRALELGVHEADLQSYWFGPISSVSAAVVRRGQMHTEHALLGTMRFQSGMISQFAFLTVPRHLEVSRRVFVADSGTATSSNWHNWQGGQILGGDGPATTLDALTSGYLQNLPTADRRRLFPDGSFVSPEQSRPSVPLSYGVGSTLSDFASAIRNRHSPEIGLEEARTAVAICEAILLASEEEREVAIPDATRPADSVVARG